MLEPQRVLLKEALERIKLAAKKNMISSIFQKLALKELLYES